MKVSNIPIAGLDTGLHGNHRAIERRLAASPVASTVLQPSFFTSVLAAPARRCSARGQLVLPTGDGQIAWIDPRDIADGRGRGARRSRPPRRPAAPHRPGGARRRRGRGPHRCGGRAARSSSLQPDLAKWHAESAGERHRSVARRLDRAPLRGRRARRARPTCPPTVERVLGRPPRPIDEWLRRRAGAALLRRVTRAGRATGRRRPRRRGRSASSPARPANPGSPSRANAAHASRIARPVARASSSAPTNASQPSTKLPNVNGMSMPWHAPSAAFGRRPGEQYEYVGPCARARRAPRRPGPASRCR